jgi:hypothetical protein
MEKQLYATLLNLSTGFCQRFVFVMLLTFVVLVTLPFSFLGLPFIFQEDYRETM